MVGKIRDNFPGIRARARGKNGDLLQLIGGLRLCPGKLTNFVRSLL